VPVLKHHVGRITTLIGAMGVLAARRAQPVGEGR
jgi:hypothetical protein